jgi:hypothetical protein
MKQPTLEITAYFAFWAAKNHEIHDLAEEVHEFARQLEKANEAERFKLCAQYIRKKQKDCLAAEQVTTARLIQ